MLLLRRIRAYHAMLATFTILAYVTGEAGLIHAWLGYAVAAVIAVRLIWAMTGVPQLGLMRFYPAFAGLTLDNVFTHPGVSRTLLLGIGTSLLAVTATGIAMDHSSARFIEEVHEALAEILAVLVVTHVCYLLLFKRPLARFMLFLDPPPNGADKSAAPTSPR
jgi:cytochrome b